MKFFESPERYLEYYVVTTILVVFLIWRFKIWLDKPRITIQATFSDTSNCDLHEIELIKAWCKPSVNESHITRESLAENGLAFAEKQDMLVLQHSDKQLPIGCSISTLLDDDSVMTLHVWGNNKNCREIKFETKLPRGKWDLIAAIDKRVAKTPIKTSELKIARATS